MKLAKRIFNVLIDILIILILIFSVLIAVLSLTQDKEGVPSLFGYAPMSVQSDSMVPEFETGDLIIAKVTDESTEYKQNDIVSFAAVIDGYKVVDTHRIVDVVEESGQIFYVTKGDNAEAADAGYQTSSSILAVYNGTRLEGLGSVLDFFKTQHGFFLAVVLPMFILFVYEAIRVARNFIAYNEAKAMDQAQDAVKAILASQGNTSVSEKETRKMVESYMAEKNLKIAKKLAAQKDQQ